jgi:amidophosphoribosyltransferase
MCGVVGVIGTPHSAKEAYQGLLLMQHRGQDAAGILTFDFNEQYFEIHKDNGHVSSVFSEDDIEKLKGHCSIGHTRYSTVGSTSSRDVQPMFLNYPFGMGLVHNGNLVNFFQLADYLKEEKKRFIFTQNDAEVLINLLAEELSKSTNEDRQFSHENLKKSIESIFEHAKGGYAVLTAIANIGLVAFRDPQGIRPLVWGERELREDEKSLRNKSNKAYLFASESKTLEFLGYTNIQNVKPGELIVIDDEGTVTKEQLFKGPTAHCMFEWVYFANPESNMDGTNVYQTRLKMGQALGKKIKRFIKENKISPDVIVPVPDTSRVSAIAASEEVGLPYREYLIKNRYIQRSFILSEQEKREKAVELKLSPVSAEIKGKKILLIDDSIVRGTTSKRIIEMVRKAGATEVYFASACPPILNPCFYGIDFPDENELVAYNRTYEEIKAELGADEIVYNELEDLKDAIGTDGLCTGCLTGEYPVDNSEAIKFKNMRMQKSQKNDEFSKRQFN